jgi:tRNA A37 threonylcarbamoyladenosine synthetase subunit TsaC/SUA5/YrdC
MLGVPIVAPSANVQGADPPRRVDDAVAPFRDWIEFAVRWYPATGTAASTLVDLTGEGFSIIREGTVSEGEITTVLGG